MSKVNSIHHIVISTKRREMTIENELREEVYRFIWAELKKLGCHLYRIGGIPNHIHLLVNLSPAHSLAEVMRIVKANTSGWLKRDERFPVFDGWGKEYFAESLSADAIPDVIGYINGQQEHHSNKNFDEELAWLYYRAGIKLHPDDLR